MNNPADITLREYIYSLVDCSGASAILDLGCGDGYDLRRIAESAAREARLIGLDSSEKSIEAARTASCGDKRLTYEVADIEQGLPYNDGSFDIVFSKNLFECIVDKEAHLRELHRILRPGGKIICAHYDWDSQLIDCDDKDLVRRIVHSFGDWKQAWMTDCDAWMGRRLWRVFQQSALFIGAVYAKTLTETRFVPGAYGWAMINDFRALTRRGLITEDEFARFFFDIEQRAARDQYLYSITMFTYVGIAASVAPLPG